MWRQERKQIVPVLQKYLERLDIKPSRFVLSALAWCENEVGCFL